ncbi:hypothetical protein [Microbacterium sp. H1-D42]|uniref:hypothetical protein n=1 Tax=Microbacterium sp. H1-D42 TaxID=2925844 RepID=UPI001F52DFF2|nr:hypothetical protein [Microbacterium sp. H1-D42]UNK71020.1 hypothetical protein MNR00_00835 [Microbacterium sp. H1-D42]
MRPSRRIPLLRGFVGATIATFVALVSHIVVGGAMPGMLGVAVPWVLSLMISTLLAGRRLSVVRLSAAVVLSQGLFHVLFVLGSFSPRGGFAPHVHGNAPMILGNGTELLPGAGLIPEDAGMWIAHATAAVLTIVALHRGERIVRALASVASDVALWLRRAVLVAVLVRPSAPSARRWALVAAPRLRARHLSALGRRGPPPALI